MTSAIAENRQRLNGCLLHYFDTTGMFDAKEPPALLRCVMCQGILPLEIAAEYARGFAAAGGNPELVVPGFSR